MMAKAKFACATNVIEARPLPDCSTNDEAPIAGHHRVRGHDEEDQAVVVHGRRGCLRIRCISLVHGGKGAA